MPACRSDPALLPCSLKMMGDSCRPTAVECSLNVKAAFCLPQLAPPPAAELLPQPQQKTDQDQTGSCKAVYLATFAISKERVHGTGISWNWAGPPWFTITACSTRRNVGRNPHPLIHCYGKDPDIWQFNLSFIHGPPINKFLEKFPDRKFQCFILRQISCYLIKLPYFHINFFLSFPQWTGITSTPYLFVSHLLCCWKLSSYL